MRRAEEDLVPKEGSNFVLDVDCVIMAIGTKLNKLILETTENLEANSRGGIGTGDDAATNREGVFAGGDAVTGAATVILAWEPARLQRKA